MSGVTHYSTDKNVTCKSWEIISPEAKHDTRIYTQKYKQVIIHILPKEDPINQE